MANLKRCCGVADDDTAVKVGFKAYHLFGIHYNPYAEETQDWYDFRNGFRSAQSVFAGQWYD